MAVPTILVNSATGSDTLASGAGPSTALTGTAASTDGAGTVVTLDGSPDLTNVATDGSHAIFLNDSTAGARNFSKITAKAGATVTVANAFGLSLTGKSWAIGGKRASIAGTTSLKLFDNNSAAGDAMPGWIIEMESGHTETLAATLVPRRAGDTSSGPITLRGTIDAATPAILTFSNNGAAIAPSDQFTLYDSFELRNTSGTKTSTIAVDINTGWNVVCRRLRINHATNYFNKGIRVNNDSGYIERCTISTTSSGSNGIEYTRSLIDLDVVGCYIYSCGGFAIESTAKAIRSIVNCIIANNPGGGARMWGGAKSHIYNNVFYGNTGHGLELREAMAIQVVNNYFNGNSGYGVNFSAGTLITAPLTDVFVRNFFLSNTSGNFNNVPTSLQIENVTSASANNANYGTSHDFSLGSASDLKAAGFPLVVGFGTSVANYMDGGAVQRQETGGTTIGARGVVIQAFGSF